METFTKYIQSMSVVKHKIVIVKALFDGIAHSEEVKRRYTLSLIKRPLFRRLCEAGIARLA